MNNDGWKIVCVYVSHWICKVHCSFDKCTTVINCENFINKIWINSNLLSMRAQKRGHPVMDRVITFYRYKYIHFNGIYWTKNELFFSFNCPVQSIVFLLIFNIFKIIRFHFWVFKSKSINSTSIHLKDSLLQSLFNNSIFERFFEKEILNKFHALDLLSGYASIW